MHTRENAKPAAPEPAPQSHTRLHDPGFFSEYLKIEVLRSIRFKTRFSVIMAELPAGLAPAEREEVAGNLVSSVTGTLRNCDILGMSGPGHLGALLPDTDHFGALTAVRKLNDVAARTAKSRGPLKSPPVFAHSTFPKDGNTSDSLIDAAMGRITAKKASIWESNGLKDMLFWTIIEDLFKKGHSTHEYSSFDFRADGETSSSFVEQVNAMAVKEIKRAPQRRGVLLISARKVSPALPIVKGLAWSNASSSATKVFLAGEREAGSSEVKAATVIYLDDERLKETRMTLFLNEDFGYCLVCRESWDGGLSCFHSSDPFLTEGLLLKFQEEYSQEGVI